LPTPRSRAGGRVALILLNAGKQSQPHARRWQRAVPPKFLKETCTYETDTATFIVDVRNDDRDS
jgi:hypothetical protein